MVRQLDPGAYVEDSAENAAFDRLIHLIAATTGAHMISVALLDLDSGDLETRSSYPGDRRTARPERIRPGENIEGWVASHAAPLAFEDVASSTHPLARLAPAGARALVALPLMYRDQVQGTVLVASAQPNAFDEGKLALLQTCADQAAAALGGVRQAASVTRDLKDAQLLLDSASALSSTLDHSQLRAYITACVRRAVACDDFFVYSYDASAAALHLLARAGQQSAQPLDVTIPVGDQRSLAAWVVRNERGRILLPGDGDAQDLTEANLKPGEWGLLAAPLTVRNRVVGVLVLARREAFRPPELETAYRLSAIIGGALENADRYERALVHQQELSSIFSSASDAIALVEADLTIVEANDAFAACIGLPQQDILGADVCGLFKRYAPGMSNLCEGASLIQRALESGETVLHTECEVVMHESGTTGSPRTSGGWLPLRYMDFSLTPMDGPNGRRVLLIGRDVTDARELEQTKTQFFSMVSHELRTPLQTISGYLDLTLAGMAGDLSADQENFLKRARASSEHLSTLVDDLLLISRRDAGQFTLHRSDADLVGLIREVVIELELFAEDAGVHLRTELPESMPVAYADVQRMTQVVRNLVTNAVKFTPADGFVTLAASQVGDKIVLTVTDTGIGIAPEHVAHIFDRFYQVSGAPSVGRYQGQGLGLAIVRIIVEGHGGTVRVDSTPGKGSTFTVQLPLHPQDMDD